MKNTFACPHCRVVLNPSVKILLVAAFGDRKGMILLSPQPGNFRYICDKNLKQGLSAGDEVVFSCPVCAGDLTSPGNKAFTRLLLLTPGQDERVVEFSRIFGTHATFIIDGQEVTSYGDDAGDLGATNFFGA